MKRTNNAMLIRQKQKKEEGENPLPLFLLFTEHSLVNFSYMRKFNFYSSWLTVLNVNSSLFGFLPMLMVSPLWSVPPSINSQTPSSM
ncbi:unknown [Prevotella sp. CAG:732]|nr:unknown [Prevotella sp. CAG:732]